MPYGFRKNYCLYTTTFLKTFGLPKTFLYPKIPSIRGMVERFYLLCRSGSVDKMLLSNSGQSQLHAFCQDCSCHSNFSLSWPLGKKNLPSWQGPLLLLRHWSVMPPNPLSCKCHQTLLVSLKENKLIFPKDAEAKDTCRSKFSRRGQN